MGSRGRMAKPHQTRYETARSLTPEPDMAETEPPRLYLLTPLEFDLSSFSSDLSRVLDVRDVACLRLRMSSRDEAEIGRAADHLRALAHDRDIAVVIESHLGLVARHGLDGVHLPDDPRGVRAARKALGAEAVVGAFCATSRHDGMNAGEAGADYVSFGPVSQSALGDGRVAEPELFEWWSEMIEVPVVAEGLLTPDAVAALWPFADFLAIGDEIWRSADPADELARLIGPLR